MAKKSFGQSKPAAAATGTLGTVAAAKEWVISTFTACNQSEVDIAKISLRIRRGGAALDDKQFHYRYLKIPPASTLKATSGWCLETGTIVEVTSDTGSVSFEMEGDENATA